MFKHEHASLYLRVASCTWVISTTIEGSTAAIQSGSAGSVCPAHPSNRVSNRMGWRSWQYATGTGWNYARRRAEWTPGEISVTCDTHEWHDSK